MIEDMGFPCQTMGSRNHSVKGECAKTKKNERGEDSARIVGRPEPWVPGPRSGDGFYY